MKKLNTDAFTLAEIMVVVAIVSLLASISVPVYIHQTRRATATEAIAIMAELRQNLNDFRINNDTYFDVAQLDGTGNIQKTLPTSVVVSTGVPTPNPSGLEVDAGTTHYFSNSSFSVDSIDHTSTHFSPGPAPVDFVIQAQGNKSQACTASITTNCALYQSRINNYRLEMDNTGRVVISYDGGTTWGPY